MTSQIISLRAVDLAIIIVYFAMVLGIGFYLRKYTKSGEDFFLAGREMSAWVAGLSFLSANLGALELKDQQEGIRHLASLGFADTSRMGLYGWSYGGFMTLYTLLHAPGLLLVGGNP